VVSGNVVNKSDCGKDILRTSNLIREVEVLAEKPGYKDTTVLEIARYCLVKAPISRSASITLIKYKRSTSLYTGSTVQYIPSAATVDAIVGANTLSDQ
jgi:hypothetical protein